MATSKDRGLPIGDHPISAASDLRYAVTRLLFDCDHVGVRSLQNGILAMVVLGLSAMFS